MFANLRRKLMQKYLRFVRTLLLVTIGVVLPLSGITSAQDSAGTICFAFQDVSTEFWVASHAAIIGALEGQGYEVVQLNGGQDANRQLEQIRDCIAQDVKAIILIAQDGESGSTIVAEAQEADIPIATFNRPPADT